MTNALAKANLKHKITFAWALIQKAHFKPYCKGKRDVERVKGIEPSYEAWEAAVLPLNYTRTF